ncbi:MAG: hypothetical protein ACLSA6_01370 [Holdemania massiliensis]
MLKFEFYGKTPMPVIRRRASALDAAVNTFVAINMMRRLWSRAVLFTAL